jgi:hypothetical protein
MADLVEGLIPILGGAFVLLMARGLLPRKPKDPERMELWRRKYGRTMTVVGAFLIVFGLLKVTGVIP